VAEQNNLTMQWGTDAEPHDFPGEVILLPHLSPDGSLLAVSTTDDGGQVLLIDTASGETVNTLPTGTTDASAADALGVVAVTDDAQVFLESNRERLMWLAEDGRQDTIDLSETAPSTQILDSTPGGVIVYDTQDEITMLVEVGDNGVIFNTRELPTSETVVNPSGTWLAYGGSWGGESQTIPYVTAQRVVLGGPELRLEPPTRNRELLALTWEDDNLLLAELYDDGDVAGLARCGIREQRCVEIELP
jgi:hypothetical protein